jgi:hypothetical protein
MNKTRLAIFDVFIVKSGVALFWASTPPAVEILDIAWELSFAIVLVHQIMPLANPY